jgi:hypothetical protein
MPQVAPVALSFLALPLTASNPTAYDFFEAQVDFDLSRSTC